MRRGRGCDREGLTQWRWCCIMTSATWRCRRRLTMGNLVQTVTQNQASGYRDTVTHRRVPRSSAARQAGLMTSPKENLLSRLRSNGRHKFSRYNGLPLRYAGGKSLAVGHVIEQLPEGLERLVSPFFGGGSVEIACAKELGIEVLGFDIFDVLTNYWQVQLESPVQLAKRIACWKPNKPTYARVKERLKSHWTRDAEIADPLELAAHYWFNHNLSYGPGFLGWMSRIYEDSRRFERLVGKVRMFGCQNLEVSHGSFESTVARHSSDFLYCDPPYYLDGDSRMFKGIYPQRNFPVHHRGFNHQRLREMLHAHPGGFVLSYNDCNAIRRWYSDFRIVEVEWQYTLGQGETRIGKNRIENGVAHHVKASHELLIVKD